MTVVWSVAGPGALPTLAGMVDVFSSARLAPEIVDAEARSFVACTTWAGSLSCHPTGVAPFPVQVAGVDSGGCAQVVEEEVRALTSEASPRTGGNPSDEALDRLSAVSWVIYVSGFRLQDAPFMDLALLPLAERWCAILRVSDARGLLNL